MCNHVQLVAAEILVTHASPGLEATQTQIPRSLCHGVEEDFGRLERRCSCQERHRGGRRGSWALRRESEFQPPPPHLMMGETLPSEAKSRLLGQMAARATLQCMASAVQLLLRSPIRRAARAVWVLRDCPGAGGVAASETNREQGPECLAMCGGVVQQVQ